MVRMAELVGCGRVWVIILLICALPQTSGAEQSQDADIETQDAEQSAEEIHDTEEAEEAPAVQKLLSAKVLVSLEPGAKCAPWVAEALAQNIERELDGYERLSVVKTENPPDQACLTSESCFLDAYSKADIDLVMRGTVQPTKLDYQLYETWTPSLVETGSITVGFGSTLIDLKQQTLRAFRPILSSGGLLDQSPYMRISGQETSDISSVDPSEPRKTLLLIVFGIALLMLGFPLLLVWLLARGPRFQRLILLPTFWIAAILGGILFVLAATTPLVHIAGLGSLLETDWKWIIGLLSGGAWGILFLDFFRFTFAPLGGIERVGHRDVFRLVKEWFYASIQRLAFVALFYVPVGVGIFYVCRTLDITTGVAALIVAPSMALFARFWISLLIESLTIAIDDMLLAELPTEENTWNIELRRYVMGYVKRTGWNIDSSLIEKTLFLPARKKGIYSYGGGFIKNRIAVSEELLMLAMGDIEDSPHEEKHVSFPNWGNGILTETSTIEQKKGKKAQITAANLDETTTTTLSIFKRTLQRKPLGQAATLLGYVVPTRVGELIPLIADDDGDLDIVRELLSEHYAWFEPDPDEEDDDTDPTDRDFLFGALTRELGAIERRDNQIATLFLVWDLWSRRRHAIIRKFFVVLQKFAQFFSGRLPTIVADAYAALHFARDHMIQYLFYLETGRRDLLTTRASPEALEGRSTKLLELVEDWKPKWYERFVLAPSIRNRLVWLSRLCDQPITEKREIWLRRILIAVFSASALMALGLTVKGSVDYHSVYEDRIRRQEERIREIEAENNEISKQRPGTHGNDQRGRQSPDQEEES